MSEYTEVATFPSSSSDKMYTVKQDEDGNLSCDCPAWKFKKPNQERACKHTRATVKGEAHQVTERLQESVEEATGARWQGLGAALADIDEYKEEQQHG